MNTEITNKTLILEETDVIVIYNLMKQILAVNKIKVEEFEEFCKYCGKPIMMKNFGFGWKPYGLKKGKLHKCKPGLKAWKELHIRDDSR
jgi:hypothetical protein